VINAKLETKKGKALAGKDELVKQAIASRDSEVPSFEKLRAAAITCRNYGYPAASAVIPLLDAANNDLATAQKNVEAWFDATMDRVSGWYKSHAQRYSSSSASPLQFCSMWTRSRSRSSCGISAAARGTPRGRGKSGRDQRDRWREGAGRQGRRSVVRGRAPDLCSEPEVV